MRYHASAARTHSDSVSEYRTSPDNAPLEFQVVSAGTFLAYLSPTMPHPLRQHMPNVVYECTSRTIQGRFLLRPSAQLRCRMIGILAAAQDLYPLVELHAFTVLSNHWEFLASCVCAEEFALFTGYVNSNFARECGRAHAWTGPFWSRRVRVIPCLDDTATIDRLRYCIAQGAKEGLVASPLDWPGASAVPALIGDMTLIGERVDRDALRRAREAAQRRDQSAAAVREADYTRTVRLQLAPLPVFRGLDDNALRGRHRALLNDVVALAAVARAGRPPLGLAAVLRQDPHAAPANFVPTPAPPCHAASAQLRRAFLQLRGAFTLAYRRVADAIAALLSPRLQRRQATKPPGPPPPATPVAASASSTAASLAELHHQVPPGMFLLSRFIRPAPPTLLTDLVFVRYADG
jgi:hypothetical protein